MPTSTKEEMLRSIVFGEECIKQMKEELSTERYEHVSDVVDKVMNIFDKEDISAREGFLIGKYIQAMTGIEQ